MKIYVLFTPINLPGVKRRKYDIAYYSNCVYEANTNYARRANDLDNYHLYDYTTLGFRPHINLGETIANDPQMLINWAINHGYGRLIDNEKRLIELERRISKLKSKIDVDKAAIKAII